MGYALDALLSAYKLKPVNVTEDIIIDIQQLHDDYREALGCIFYPKTVVSYDDIMYLENFWASRRERLMRFVELIQFYGDDDVVYDAGNGQTTGNFSISIIMSHFKPIKRLMGISTADNCGNLILRAIIIPEHFVVDRLLDIYYRSPYKLVDKMTENPAIKFIEDGGLYVKSDRPTVLVIDINELSSAVPFKTGSTLGRCDCVEDMIAIYVFGSGMYYLVIIEHSIWFEFIVRSVDFSHLGPLTHVLLRKIKENFINGQLRRIPLQFIISNITNYRSIDMLNYDEIANIALRQNTISECLEYCLLTLKNNYATINQTIFYQIVNQLYPNIVDYYNGKLNT